MDETGNLLSPLVFEDGLVDQFLARHRCWCRRPLMKVPAPNRRWWVKCCEHGLMSSTTTMNAAAAEQAESDEQFAMRELTR